MDLPDTNNNARRFNEPYTPHHRVPNIQEYEEEVLDRKKTPDPTAKSAPSKPATLQDDADQDGSEQATEPGLLASGMDRVRSMFEGSPQDQSQPNFGQPHHGEGHQRQAKSEKTEKETPTQPMNAASVAAKTEEPPDTSEPREDAREVTDPVTHLPITIHDSTKSELKAVAVPSQSGQIPGEREVSDESVQGQENEIKWTQGRHESLQRLVDREVESDDANGVRTRRQLLWTVSVEVGIFALVLMTTVSSAFFFMDRPKEESSRRRRKAKVRNEWPIASIALLAIGSFIVSVGIASSASFYISRVLARVDSSKHAPKGGRGKEEEQKKLEEKPETAAWLNSTLASVWPLVNPDLFTSLSDMLEDVMQASMPKFIKMIKVADLGQGSEALRLLGIRWLREGAAGEERDGMQAEEGDFVNLELAFAYKARPSNKRLRSKTKNAHILIEFYLAGGITAPVWVELKGAIGTARIRLQLSPDPPFFSVMTCTLLGQPKVTMSCVPMMRNFPNIMDVPLISNFVQSSINAALNEYVAPRSITLDLKQMLVGDDFKKDVSTRGILLVRILYAREFKNGDGSKNAFNKLGKAVGVQRSKGGSDGYVSVGWSKFGKPLWLTRIILSCQEPNWDESTAILVGIEEINAGERLQLKLWDSDTHTADDELGTVEVDLKELMNTREMKRREDKLNAKDDMPGTLTWEVGYFPKTKLMDLQIKKSSVTSDEEKTDPEIVVTKVHKDAERKTRESQKNETDETSQQKKQDLKKTGDDIINHAPPAEEFPSGVLCIQIHQLDGLQLERLGTNRQSHNENDEEEQEEGDDLPSSYCSVILNHRKIYKTRTKPKTSMPFFNAATERFIRDWRTAEIIVSIHDFRMHETNALLGCIVLPLRNVFRESSQTYQTYPIVGGLGYGHAKISLVFRSLDVKLPRELLGWEVGTLEIGSKITSSGLSEEYSTHRLTITSSCGGKGRYTNSEAGKWSTRKHKKVHIALKQRYASHLLLSLRKNKPGPDSSPAFAVLWLKDVVDDEDLELDLPVYRTAHGNLDRAQQNIDEQGYGDKLGNFKVKLHYWPGLSGYHKKIANESNHLFDVMEVLDCANEAKELRDDVSDGDHVSSDSDSASEDGEKVLATAKGGRDRDNKLERGGFITDAKEYKREHKILHRHHRGLMQWKGARNLKWVKEEIQDKSHSVVHKITSRSKHEKLKDDIETEV